MVEIHIVDQSPAVKNAWLVRCHDGSLRVGDRLFTALSPTGQPRAVDLECFEISLYEDVLVDELELNDGGMIRLRGSGAAVLAIGWLLTDASVAS